MHLVEFPLSFLLRLGGDVGVVHGAVKRIISKLTPHIKAVNR